VPNGVTGAMRRPAALPAEGVTLFDRLIAYRRRGLSVGRGRIGHAQLPLPLFFLLLFLGEISLTLGKSIIGLGQLAILVGVGDEPIE
jgi:hypothetical protein